MSHGNDQDVRDHIRDTVDDLVSNFLYYDRKEDEDLPRGAIDEFIETGGVTVAEIVEWFDESLNRALGFAP